MNSHSPFQAEIDEAGHVTRLRLGLVHVICGAGTAVWTSPMLIRANHRPVQTDFDWRNKSERIWTRAETLSGSWGEGHALLVAACQMPKRGPDWKNSGDD
jgi:hypothetical protein